MKRNGFTLIELMIVVSIIGIILAVIWSGVVNNRGWTEQRAYQGLEKFIASNNIQVKRKTCAGDSDADGYGTCTIVTTENETITIQCPTDWMAINVWGAHSCKEIPVFRMQVK